MRTPTGSPNAGLALSLVVSFLFGAIQAAEVDWDKPDKKWRQGPVKYLMTKDEIKEYKKLKTDEERSAFVSEFWSQRDPNPDTETNEYRDAFYARARDAASLYSEDGGKGWQDDRGRVYILLGPPNDQVEGAGLLGGDGTSSIDNPTTPGSGFGPPGSPAGSRPQTPRKTVKFIYLVNPLTGEGRLELNFTSDPASGYQLEERLDWTDPVLRGLAPTVAAEELAVTDTTSMQTPHPPALEPAVAAPVIPEPVPEPPTPQAELMAQVRAEEVESTIPMDVLVNYYKAEDDSTSATLTIALDRDELGEAADDLILSAEIVDSKTKESVQRFFQADHFGPQEAADAQTGAVLYQSSRALNPGRYVAYFAVKNPSSGAVGSLEKEIEVPSFGEQELKLSTVTLARKIERVPGTPDPENPAPFVLGAFRVVPRPENVYQKGDDLAFYYQIYGAARDEVTKTPKLDLSYAFEKLIGEDWRMVGGRPAEMPGQTGLVQAFSLPMKGWPTGEYRVSITVKDAIAGVETTAELPFSITEPEKTSAAKSN